MTDSHDGRARPDPDEDGFRLWASLRLPKLRAKAFLLSGNWHLADDLVQETLVTVYGSWSRIATGGNVDAYANRTLVHRHIDDRRRPWRREHSVSWVPDRADQAAQQDFAHVESADALLAAALATLPASQRAVLVLRFTDDLSLEQIADVMNLPVGTVKSRLSRGTERVRVELGRLGHPMAADPRQPVPATEGHHEH